MRRPAVITEDRGIVMSEAGSPAAGCAISPQEMVFPGRVRQYHRGASEPSMIPDGPPPSATRALPSSATATLSPETTVELLTLAKAGNEVALNRLLSRCMPALRRWAHGR